MEQLILPAFSRSAYGAGIVAGVQGIDAMSRPRHGPGQPR
jgi:hypothetical protein